VIVHIPSIRLKNLNAEDAEGAEKKREGNRVIVHIPSILLKKFKRRGRRGRREKKERKRKVFL